MENIIVPTEALETDDYSEPLAEGEKRKTIKPEEGDPVTFTVKGTIKSITGDSATVHVAFIDGKRVEEEGKPESEDEGDSIRKKSQEADEE